MFDFLIVCSHVKTEPPGCYVLTRDDVVRLVEVRKNGELFLPPRTYSKTDEYHEKWEEVIGSGLTRLPIPAPPVPKAVDLGRETI